MKVVFAQRLILLTDGVGRVRRRSLISFRNVRSWLWSELMLEWATQEICGMRPQWPWDSPGPLGSSLDSIRASQGNPHLGTRESVLGRWRRSLQQSGRVPRGYPITTTTRAHCCSVTGCNAHPVALSDLVLFYRFSLIEHVLINIIMLFLKMRFLKIVFTFYKHVHERLTHY